LPLYHPLLRYIKAIRLPEYEYIGLTKVEVDLLDTKPLQRLRRIHQLPSAHLVYPGASHTRFEHSLGVMHLAGEATMYIKLNEEAVNRKEKNISMGEILRTMNEKKFEDFLREVQLARLVGLLHDIGHGPFSHTFELFHQMLSEKRNGEEFNHELKGLEIIKNCDEIRKALEDNGFTPEDIIGTYIPDIKNTEKLHINPSSKLFYKIKSIRENKRHITEILKGEVINVDRLNYLVLDAHRSGAVEYGHVDAYRLIYNLYYSKQRKLLCVGKKAEAALLRYIEAYKHMYDNVYLHKLSRAVDIHIAYMLKCAIEAEILDNIVNPSWERLLELYDDALIYELKQKLKNTNKSSNRQAKIAQQLLDMYLKRKVLREAYRIPIDHNKVQGKGYNEIEEDIRKKANLEKDNLIIVYKIETYTAGPPPVTEDALKHYKLFDEDTWTEISPDETFLDRIRPLTRIIKHYYGVYTEPEHKDKVKTACKTIYE